MGLQRLRHEWTCADQWLRHQARPTRSMGGSKPGRPWPLVHVTPRPATVSERPKTASKAAVSGIPITVSSLCRVFIYLMVRINIELTI